MQDDFDEYPDLLHLQMHAFTRRAARAQKEADWPTHIRAMRLANLLWRRPAPDLLNALNVSFLEHLEFRGLDGELAWSHLSPALQEGWRAMDAYMAELALLKALPRKQRPPKLRRKRR